MKRAHLREHRMRRLRGAYWLLLILIAIVLAFPVANRFSRLFLLVSIPAAAAGFIPLLPRRRVLRWAPLAAVFAAGIVLILPGRQHDAERLQARYVQAIHRYSATRYAWGGENRFGIDCSGLVRRGLVDACIAEGLTTLNPRLLRSAVDLWWHDCSARSLRDGYDGRTLPVSLADSLSTAPIAALQPGDLAATADGLHVMAYVGDSCWVEADPTLGRVVALSPSDSSPWLERPVAILRWKMLR